MVTVLMVVVIRNPSRTAVREERPCMMPTTTEAEVDDSIVKLRDQIRDSSALTTVSINDGSIYTVGELYRTCTTAVVEGRGVMATIYCFIEVKSIDKYVETRRI